MSEIRNWLDRIGLAQYTSAFEANDIVVVGDDKQLPPTNFFKMVNAGNEYEEDDPEHSAQPDRPTDFESILTLARTRGMSERMLAWPTEASIRP